MAQPNVKQMSDFLADALGWSAHPYSTTQKELRTRTCKHIQAKAMRMQGHKLDTSPAQTSKGRRPRNQMEAERRRGQRGGPKNQTSEPTTSGDPSHRREPKGAREQNGPKTKEREADRKEGKHERNKTAMERAQEGEHAGS